MNVNFAILTQTFASSLSSSLGRMLFLPLHLFSNVYLKERVKCITMKVKLSKQNWKPERKLESVESLSLSAHRKL